MSEFGNFECTCKFRKMRCVPTFKVQAGFFPKFLMCVCVWEGKEPNNFKIGVKLWYFSQLMGTNLRGMAALFQKRGQVSGGGGLGQFFRWGIESIFWQRSPLPLPIPPPPQQKSWQVTFVSLQSTGHHIIGTCIAEAYMYLHTSCSMISIPDKGAVFHYKV